MPLKLTFNLNSNLYFQNMGVTKQYLRVAPGPVFGVVASHRSNILVLPGSSSKNTCCAVGACENVYIWDLVKKEKVKFEFQII